MSCDHQDTYGFSPPNATNEFHRQPPSTTTGHNLSCFSTLRVPLTPSPMETTKPESRMAAALGRAILTIPSTSFQDAATTTVNPLLRTFSDTNSSANQQDPSKSPRNNNPLRRANSDASEIDDLQDPPRNKKPLRRALSDTPPRATAATGPSTSTLSETPKQIPISEKLKKMKDMVREIEQRCWEVMREEYVEDEDPIPIQTPTTAPQPLVTVKIDDEEVKEECVGVERLKEGLKVELRCSCGNGFEILLKDNYYCFYRLK